VFVEQIQEGEPWQGLHGVLLHGSCAVSTLGFVQFGALSIRIWLLCIAVYAALGGSIFSL